MIAYTPSYDSGDFDRWTGVPIGQPSTPSSARTGIADAAYFGIQVENNILALVRASVASPFYGRAWTCVSGLNTGDPIRISDSGTVALAAASGSGTSDVAGFVRDKDSTGTTAYIAHFWQFTGNTGGTTGARAYLTDAGGISITAGTFPKVLGIYDSATGGILFASPLSLASCVAAGSPSSIGTGADSGTSSLAARLDHKHALTFSGAPGYVGTGVLDSGVDTGAARLDHAHQIDSGIAKEITKVSISGTAESGNYRDVTIAMLDARGETTGSRRLVEAWLGDTGYGWETSTTPTGFFIVSGTTGNTPTANTRLRGITDANGNMSFHVNTDGVITYVFHVSVCGKVSTLNLAFA